jgi:hypothetical protein
VPEALNWFIRLAVSPEPEQDRQKNEQSEELQGKSDSTKHPFGAIQHTYSDIRKAISKHRELYEKNILNKSK